MFRGDIRERQILQSAAPAIQGGEQVNQKSCCCGSLGDITLQVIGVLGGS